MTGTIRRLDTCYTCRFWVGFGVRERGPKGQCRRYPPTATDRAPAGAFPITQLGEWCGEWQRASGRMVADRPEAQAERTLYDDLKG